MSPNHKRSEALWEPGRDLFICKCMYCAPGVPAWDCVISLRIFAVPEGAFEDAALPAASLFCCLMEPYQ